MAALKTKRRVLSKQSSIPTNDNFSALYLGTLMKLGYKKKDALEKIRQVQSLNLQNEQEIINRLLTK